MTINGKERGLLCGNRNSPGWNKKFSEDIIPQREENVKGDRSKKMQNLYSCTEVAERYGVSVYTVYKWVREKELGAVKVNRQNYKIREEDLLRFENEHATINYETI